jgi:hypothetical protein
MIIVVDAIIDTILTIMIIVINVIKRTTGMTNFIVINATKHMRTTLMAAMKNAVVMILNSMKMKLKLKYEIKKQMFVYFTCSG